MAREYDGTVTRIDLPCPLLIEVAHSIAVDDNLLHVLRGEGTYASGSQIQFEVALFEKYLGAEGHSDVPVIKYSARSYAPALCDKLALRTPNYYRTLETESPGLGDPLEGCRITHESADGSELILTSSTEGTSIVLDAGGVIRTDGCFKTFLYCASLYQDDNVMSRERASTIFGQDYTHGSVFQSSKQLAHQIIKSFAATVSRSMLENAQPAEGKSFAGTCAWIVHGPVQYLRDSSPTLRRIESLFTKTDDEVYRNQNEYRFWVGFSNTPVQSDEATLSLPLPKDFATLVELKFS